VGSKAFAVILVILVGGVAAYDVKFVMDRQRARAPARVAAVGDNPENEPGQTSAAESPAAQVAAVGGNPENEPEQTTAAESPAAPVQQEEPDLGPPQQLAKNDGSQRTPGNQTTSSLQDILDGNWPEPFEGDWNIGETSEPATPTPTPTPEPQPEPLDPFQGRTPVVSAVLITGTNKRAIVDRQIVREGSKLAGGGAEVWAITPDGVEVRFGDVTLLLPVGGAGPSTGTDD
jgi:hypothetical protein